MLLLLAVHASTYSLSKLHNPILGEGIETQTSGLKHSTDHPKNTHTHTASSQTLLQSHWLEPRTKITLNLITLVILPFGSVFIFKSSWSPAVLPFCSIPCRTYTTRSPGQWIYYPFNCLKRTYSPYNNTLHLSSVFLLRISKSYASNCSSLCSHMWYSLPSYRYGYRGWADTICSVLYMVSGKKRAEGLASSTLHDLSKKLQWTWKNLLLAEVLKKSWRSRGDINIAGLKIKPSLTKLFPH